MDPYAFALEKVQEAGALLAKAQEEGFTTGSKAGNARDIVTSTDAAVSEFLVAEIKKAFPDHGIYSEEGSGVAEGGSYAWAIDPIDGSSNFSRGIPHYAVCVGLLHDGVPEVGAVYDPSTRELFSFKRGQGAFLNGNPIRVSSVTALSDAQVMYSPGSRNPALWDWAGTAYRKLLEHAKKRSMTGSSALDLCYIAAGRADAGAYGTLSTLDVAGAFGILTEAGGAYSDTSGNQLSWSAAPQKVFMANGHVLLDAIRTLLD